MPSLSADALLAALPLAVPVALVAGLGSRRVWAGAVAGVLACLAGALGHGATAAGAPAPTRLLELVVPGLLAAPPEGAVNPVAQAWLGTSGHGAPFDVGLTGLLAATLGVAVAPGIVAWMVRVVLLAGLVGLSVEAPLGLELAGLLTQLALATLAGLGLAATARLDDNDTATLAVGGVAVVVAGTLAVLATSAGSQEPRQLLEPFLESLRQQGQTLPSTLQLEAAGERLVTALDRAALCAFAAMAVLLLTLKARKAWAVGLMATVAIGELVWR